MRCDTRCDTTARKACGFTLIELLVVLLIMGLLVGMVSAIVRPDDRGLVRLEAERLAQLLELAAAESRLSGTSIGWTADASGYRFWRMTVDAAWSEIRDEDLLRARILPQGMAISGLQVENNPAGDLRLIFAPYAPPLPFTVELSLGAERIGVAASPIGEIRVLPGEGTTHGGSVLQ
jgi:general secretion pathway protein H